MKRGVTKFWVEIRELLALFYRFRCWVKYLVIAKGKNGNSRQGNQTRRKTINFN